MKPFIAICLAALLLTGCSPLWGNLLPPANMPQATPNANLAALPPTPTPFQPEGFTPPPTLTPAPLPGEPTYTPYTLSLWIAPSVPALLRQAALATNIPLASSPESATIKLDEINPQSASGNSQSAIWFYSAVTPFPTLADGVSLADIQGAWIGADTGPFAGRPLWMDETTLAAFTAFWGPPVEGAVSVAPVDSIVDSAWAEQPAWAIVPFESLDPRWKVLTVDGQSPVHNDFDPQTYPLKLAFSIQTSIASLPAELAALPATNRDPAKLTVLAMTGVTALVRATADQMERRGILYPGEEVRSVLRAADLTHISNEISFDPDCPPPDPWTDSLQFCSDPKYIELLEDVGTDVVELTGNHLLDYGPSDLLYTLDMYDQRGWKYFAGGRDLTQALQPLTLTDHGNKLAFLGCNYAGPPGDFATDSRPGSTPCDYEMLHSQIADLRTQGYLPIVTFQYSEYYQSFPSENERTDFLGMAQAGAVIVSGSQAHMPASMEFDGTSFVHYGLGNLFFDQMSHLMPDGSLIYDTRNVFIDRHVFYDGRYLGTELLTYVIENYARPRLMTPAERTQFLHHIFASGGW